MKIIKNGLFITMDKERRVINEGAVVIDGKHIKEVGKARALCPKYPTAEIMDATDHVVLPGFINAHNHLFQILFRGMGENLSLSEWVSNIVWPMCQHIGRDEYYLATLLSSAEMLSSGITTFVDSQFITKDKECCDGIAQGVEEIGIRGVIGRCALDSDPAPHEFREPVDVAIREASRVIETYHDKADGRLTVRVEALNEATASREMVLAMTNVARRYQVGFSMHVAETARRVEECRRKYGCPSIEWLWNLGVLGPDVLLAHCVWVNDTEIHLLSETHARVVHNPVANQYLGDGVAPITKMLDKGIVVAVGTDGAASNNGQDIFEAMKSAVLLQRVSQLTARALTSQKALEMVTIDAAQAIGMADRIGSLEPGKFADIVLINTEAPQLVPSASILSNLVYATTSKAVDMVMVNGCVLFRNGEIMTLDQREVVRECNEKARSLIEKTGISLQELRNWKIV